MQELQIVIEPYSEGGFMYNIYNDIDQDSEAIDGGIHIGDSIAEALDSAVDMAKGLILRDVMYGDKNGTK